MGVRQTTEQREALKAANPTAQWAKKVNLMSPEDVQAEYNKLQPDFKRSKTK